MEHYQTLGVSCFLTVEDRASEAMLLVTVEPEEGSSDTCSFPLSSVNSTARGLLQYCQSNTVTLSFPWMSGGSYDCGSSVSGATKLLIIITYRIYFNRINCRMDLTQKIFLISMILLSNDVISILLFFII